MRFFALTALTTALLCATAPSLALEHPHNHDHVDSTLATSASADTVAAQALAHPHNRHSRTSMPSTFLTSASPSGSAAAETIAASTKKWRRGIDCPKYLCPRG
ncbi:hypothetical protein B5807_08285 [Epicoccum nigrum]|uniref:Uncharacterized protein n=1 Tax=Epicoccum nigrum TaxID=105696 RepID=A0A1Y2LQV5_EPING|nr:hypothetical protein B5807_08285 [Epicoccum nigrum]